MAFTAITGVTKSSTQKTGRQRSLSVKEAIGDATAVACPPDAIKSIELSIKGVNDDSAFGKVTIGQEFDGKVILYSGDPAIRQFAHELVSKSVQYCQLTTNSGIQYTFSTSDGSPALIDGKVIIGNHGSILDAINPVNGEFVWRVPFWGSAVASTAVPYGGLFYIGASDLRRVTCFDPKDGRVVWRTDVYGWEWGRPAVTGDFIYVGVGGVNPYPIRHLGSMTALDRKTGKISWRWPMPELPGVLVYGFASAPVIEGHMLVIGGVDGTLYAFPAQ